MIDCSEALGREQRGNTFGQTAANPAAADARRQVGPSLPSPCFKLYFLLSCCHPRGIRRDGAAPAPPRSLGVELDTPVLPRRIPVSMDRAATA